MRTANWVMRNPRGQQEHFALANRDLYRLSVFLDVHREIALELVKQFLALVPVIVLSRVRPANYHYNKVIVAIYALVPYRRLQQMPMLINPLF